MQEKGIQMTTTEERKTKLEGVGSETQGQAVVNSEAPEPTAQI